MLRDARRPGFSRTRGARRTRSPRKRAGSGAGACCWRGRQGVRRLRRRPPQCGGGPGADARSALLGAQREAYDELRAQVRAAVDGLRGEPGYDRLLEALARMARLEAGPGATVTASPDGGVVARSPGVLVDCSLPRLADLAVEALDGEVRELWAP